MLLPMVLCRVYNTYFVLLLFINYIFVIERERKREREREREREKKNKSERERERFQDEECERAGREKDIYECSSRSRNLDFLNEF